MDRNKQAEGSSERKGKIYECFVGLAFEHAFGSYPETEGTLPGVIADQDTIWPTIVAPQIVASVTHWGSHEAAKMKFWRIHEDFYEIAQAFPDVQFFSIVFERNEDSDQNLCLLLEELTSGRGISDLTDPSIKVLQTYVQNAKDQNSFGSDLDSRKRRTAALFLSDPTFKNAVLDLARTLKMKSKGRKRTLADFEVIKRGSNILNRDFRLSRDTETFFKPALIALLDIGDSLGELFASEYSLDSLPFDLKTKLLSNGGLKEDPDDLSGALLATPFLLQIFDQGYDWCHEMLTNLRALVSDPNHALYSYHDHLVDVIESGACAKRVKILEQTKSSDAMQELISDWGDGMNRCWPIDYAVAIQRSQTKGGKFGIQRLSEMAGIPYRGAPVSCPLPCYSSGDKSRLGRGEIKSLANSLLQLKSGWPEHALGATTIQRDRRITLMKKLAVLDACIEVGLRKYIPAEYFKGTQIVRHPFSSRVDNVLAGSTEFNLVITNGSRRVLLFVASAYETSHKHKELSGRLRGARSAGYVTDSDLPLMVIDGNLLSGNSRTSRVKMFSASGWEGAFLVNEMQELATVILGFLENGKRSESGDQKRRPKNPLDARIRIPLQAPGLMAAELPPPLKLKRKGGHG